MRYPAGHKEQTRAKILRAAAKVFRREGYHAVSVDKVMEEAGLTAGGFYAHFGSKEGSWPRRWRCCDRGRGPARQGSRGGGRPRAATGFRGMLPGPGASSQDRGRMPAPGPGVRGCGDGRTGQGKLRGDRPRPGSPAPGPCDRGPHGGSRLAILALCVGDLGVADRSRTSLSAMILAACRDLATAGLIADDRVQTPASSTRKRKRKESEIHPLRPHSRMAVETCRQPDSPVAVFLSVGETAPSSTRET